MFNILVTEDDKNLRKLISTCLKKNNCNVLEATNGQEALQVLDKEYIDLIISDVMMPEMDGFELIKELRECKYNMPILLITAKGDIKDKKQGFEYGADDYMVKPIDIEELMLRVKVLLKRSQSVSEKKLVIGDLVLNYDDKSVTRKNKEYFLTQKEFLLLYKLLSTPNITFSRQDLLEEIWGLESESDYRTIDVHIKRIREKMQDIDEFDIVSVRGIGYKGRINEKK